MYKLQNERIRNTSRSMFAIEYKLIAVLHIKLFIFNISRGKDAHHTFHRTLFINFNQGSYTSWANKLQRRDTLFYCDTYGCT